MDFESNQRDWSRRVLWSDLSVNRNIKPAVLRIGFLGAFLSGSSEIILDDCNNPECQCSSKEVIKSDQVLVIFEERNCRIC